MRIFFSSIVMRTLAVACCAALPLLSQAAGLGRLSVQSALGQPLSAEVEIISLQPGEDDALTARLAPAEAFRQAGIEFNPALLSLRFSIERRDGKPFLRLTSSQPVNEPFLDLLLELQWNTGRLVREYTFLLDPPGFRTAPPVAVAPAPAPAAPIATAPREPVRAEPLGAPRPAPARPAATHEVRRGDTLANVARQNIPEGVSFNQMLVALFRANTEAFDGDNINRLRAGRILNIPDREAVAALDAEEARRFVQTQAADFDRYRRRLAGAVAAAEGEAASGQRSVSGAITTPAPAPAAGPKDELKLSKAETAKPSAASSRAAREDDAAARDRALQEMQSRVAELEKNVAALQKLLELRNRQLAELQAKAGAKPLAEAPAQSAPPAAPVPAAPAPAEPKAAPPAAPEAAKAAPPAPTPGEAQPAPPAAVKPEAPKPSTKPKPAPPAPPPPPPSLLEEFLDNPMALGGLGLVVLLLAVYGAWAWRRKKQAAQASFHDTLLAPTFAGGAAAAPSLLAEPLSQPAGAPAAGAPGIGLEPQEVDPVAEADVYMAYGRDAQAEEILKEALQRDPNRVVVLAKLIEIYAHRRDPKALEQSALKLKALTQGEGADWDKAAVLGRSVDPQNGLYAGAVGAVQPAAAPAPSSALDFNLDAIAPAQAEAGPDAQPVAKAADITLDFDLGAAPADATQTGTAAAKEEFSPDKTLVVTAEQAADLSGGLDFDLGAPEAKEQPKEETVAKAQPAADAGLDFDLGFGDTPAADAAKNAGAGPGEKDDKADAAASGMALDFEPSAKTPAESPASEGAGSIGSIDFDLDLDLGAAQAPSGQAEKPAAEVPLDLSSISLDLDLPAESPATAASADAHRQEVATKLDLARAYEEMGDKNGARELLNEVLKDGDSAQQNQAQEILVRLG